MKVSKPISMSIPRIFIDELDVYLISKNLQNLKKEYFYFLFNKIITSHLLNRNKKENSEFINLNMKFLCSETIPNIRNYIEILKNGEFIISDNHYEIGKKSVGYKLNLKYLDSEITQIKIETNSALFKKTNKILKRKKSHLSRNEETHLKTMRKHFDKLKFNYEEAFIYCQHEQNLLKRMIYLNSINQLNDKRFRYFKRNKTNNRLDTNLTNLKSELRSFLMGDYVSIDLKNSQPFFLSQLLKQINNTDNVTLCNMLDTSSLFKSFGINRIKEILKIRQNQEIEYLEDLKNFENEVINGTLYETFQKKFGSDLSRKEIKEIIFEVFYSNNLISTKSKFFIPFEKDKMKFEEIFPFIYKSIFQLKKKDNRWLPIFLQKLESYIFIDCIARKLVEVGIVPLTIHDSIIVEKTQLKYTMEIIEQVFKSNFDIIPKFEIKSL
jgi:hypothetical protein